MDTDGQGQIGAAWTGRAAIAIYLLAGVAYITLGIFIPEVLFSSWWEGVPFLLLFVWAADRLRKRLA
ncbi:hypothetical protein BH23CHL2_BH23CHL2_16330 [soil metagenome]